MHSTNVNLFQGSAQPQFEEVCRNGSRLLLVWGSEDQSVPVWQCEKLLAVAQAYGNAKGGARAVVCDGMSHNVFVEHGGPRCKREIAAFCVEVHAAEEGGAG